MTVWVCATCGADSDSRYTLHHYATCDDPRLIERSHEQIIRVLHRIADALEQIARGKEDSR
jgi:hypothetical protein